MQNDMDEIEEVVETEMGQHDEDVEGQIDEARLNA